MEQLPCSGFYGPLLSHLLGIVSSTFITVLKEPINHGINTDQLPINGSRISSINSSIWSCIGPSPHLNVKVDEGIMIVRLNSESHHTLLQGVLFGENWFLPEFTHQEKKKNTTCVSTQALKSSRIECIFGYIVHLCPHSDDTLQLPNN